MTRRENFLSLIRRQGYESVPSEIMLCPSLAEKFRAYCEEHDFSYDTVFQPIAPIRPRPFDIHVYDPYYAHKTFKPGTVIDETGVAHEPGSTAAFHMTRMHHPMQAFDSVEQILAYPFIQYEGADESAIRAEVERCHREDRVASSVRMNAIWEPAWYLRGMNELMMDMLTDEPMAAALLDRITENITLVSQAYARCGVDTLFLGDDVGMQKSIMMSEGMYCEWLKPRLKHVIDSARAIKPDILVFYHSCGYVTPLIDHLIDAGVDVLNPVQPECMDFRELHDRFGSRLSFCGTLGTQTTMPFGTPQEVRDTIFRNLDIAGNQGGLFPEPTHLLEPEVPVENVVAYLQACRDYTR